MSRIRLLLIVAGALAAAPASAVGATGDDGALRALQRAEALFAGHASGADPAPSRNATLILRDLSSALPQLRGPERRRATAILGRPSQKNDQFGNYFGVEAPASPVCDRHFCVHWSKSAKHAPAKADTSPANGVPDYVDEVLAAAAKSHAVENVTLGWTAARPDGTTGARNGRGGAGQVDIYLYGLRRGLFGYAASDPGERGRRRSAYLVIDNDYARFDGQPLDLMRVTVAHEYNHVLQFAYDALEDAWMFESTATWVEDYVYPDVNDYFNFLAEFVRRPFKPLAEVDRNASRLYGSAMWNHWLAAQLGPATIRDAWAQSPSAKPSSFAVAAYNRAIKAAGGTTFSRQFAGFAAASAEWNSSGAFPDAGLYPEMARSGRLRGRTKFDLDHTAYRIYKVVGGGDKKLRVRSERGTQSAVALVGRAGPNGGGTVTIASAYMPRGGRATVKLPNAGQYSRVSAVVINADGRVRGKSRNYSRDGRRFVVKLKR